MVVYNLSGLNLRSYPIPSSVVILKEPKINPRREEAKIEEKDSLVENKSAGGVGTDGRN